MQQTRLNSQIFFMLSPLNSEMLGKSLFESHAFFCLHEEVGWSPCLPTRRFSTRRIAIQKMFDLRLVQTKLFNVEIHPEDVSSQYLPKSKPSYT